MRSWVSAAVAIAAALVAAHPVLAQELVQEPPPPPASSAPTVATPAPALPKRPIPYTALASKPRPWRMPFEFLKLKVEQRTIAIPPIRFTELFGGRTHRVIKPRIRRGFSSALPAECRRI